MLELREFMYTSCRFQIPARTLFLGKSLLTIMGICSGLNPQLDLPKDASALYGGVTFGERIGKGHSRLYFYQAKKTLTEVITLPEKLNRLITGLEVGEIRIHPSRSFELNLLQSQKTGKVE